MRPSHQSCFQRKILDVYDAYQEMMYKFALIVTKLKIPRLWSLQKTVTPIRLLPGQICIRHFIHQNYPIVWSHKLTLCLDAVIQVVYWSWYNFKKKVIPSYDWDRVCEIHNIMVDWINLSLRFLARFSYYVFWNIKRFFKTVANYLSLWKHSNTKFWL